MVKRRLAASSWPVYAALTLLNLCLVVMFAVILYPAPVAPVVDVRVASVMPIAFHPQERVIHIGTPTRIVVPSVGIDIGVRTGTYSPENQTWTIDDRSAFFADTSTPPNDNNGMTLIYGHGTAVVFGSISNIQGGEAKVYTQEGLVFNYEYASSQQVTPTDTSVITSDGPPELVLQTCSGVFDAYRTLVTFRLTGVTGYEG